MLSLLGCQSDGCIGGYICSLCLHMPLFEIVNALACFLYQFQILLEYDHAIDWIMGILFLNSNQELGR